MSFQRIGTATGVDGDGCRQHVMVYRDGEGFKLCGRGGSHIVEQPAIEAALKAVASQYRLAEVAYQSSWRRP